MGPGTFWLFMRREDPVICFTPYKVLTRQNDTRDPLGFQTMRSRLTDRFYPQFTVNTSSPCALGFFCWALDFLEGRRIRPASGDFAHRFRDLEILLGCMAARSSKSAIVNITRYSRLPGHVTLSEAKKPGYDLYTRLGYGILGFYRSMAVKWGLLQADGRLSAAGGALAAAWDARAGKGRAPFSSVAENWLGGATPLDGLGVDYFDCFAPAVAYWGTEERAVWKGILEAYCLDHPGESPMWESPPPERTLGLLEDEAARPAFFAELEALYREHEALAGTFAACAAYERFTALVQFVFEWEYVNAGLAEGVRDKAPVLRNFLLKETVKAAEALVARLGAIGLAWNLCDALMNAPSYDALKTAVIDHHMAHQAGKGALAYLTRDGVQLANRVDAEAVKRLSQSVGIGAGAGSAEGMMRRLVWVYRGEWFFKSAHAWAQAAGGWP